MCLIFLLLFFSFSLLFSSLSSLSSQHTPLSKKKSGSLEWDEFKKAVTSDVRVVAIEKVNHYLSDDTRWSRISLRMAVIRQWKYYGVKICSILILISLLAFPMFRLGQHELEARINLILTLFLSATAFQFVVGEALPKVGYITVRYFFFLK